MEEADSRKQSWFPACKSGLAGVAIYKLGVSGSSMMAPECGPETLECEAVASGNAKVLEIIKLSKQPAFKMDQRHAKNFL